MRLFSPFIFSSIQKRQFSLLPDLPYPAQLQSTTSIPQSLMVNAVYDTSSSGSWNLPSLGGPGFWEAPVPQSCSTLWRLSPLITLSSTAAWDKCPHVLNLSTLLRSWHPLSEWDSVSLQLLAAILHAPDISLVPDVCKELGPSCCVHPAPPPPPWNVCREDSCMPYFEELPWSSVSPAEPDCSSSTVAPSTLQGRLLCCDNSCRKCILTIDHTPPTWIHCETSFLLSTSSSDSPNTTEEGQKHTPTHSSLIYLCNASPTLWSCLSKWST
jgi:hypothetical protein